MQTAVGSEMLKGVILEFRLYQKELTTSFATLSAENAELKRHLREALHFLRLFTTGHSHSHGTDPVSTPQDAFENPVGDNDAGDEVLVEEEFADIHAYSQSKCITPSPMTWVISQPYVKPEEKENAYGTTSVVDKVEANVAEEKTEEIGNSGGEVEGQKDATVSAGSADENSNEEDESWLAHIDNDLEPLELTK